jgi:glutamate/tyrosine decarboxylase-like PLP-dependent enzyme
MAMPSGRFFGWVIGGTLPSALAADWLTSTWDQNGASNLTAPAEAVIEQVCGEWAKEMLGLPALASFGLVTGCQMAHTTALASARHKLLRPTMRPRIAITGRAPDLRTASTAA